MDAVSPVPLWRLSERFTGSEGEDVRRVEDAEASVFAWSKVSNLCHFTTETSVVKQGQELTLGVVGVPVEHYFNALR